MLKNLRNRLSIARDWYNSYKKVTKLITNVTIKNKKLYHDLERECKKKHGLLTYSEFLTIDQFGDHGFYATSKSHGKTDIDLRWGLALAKYLQKNKHDTIIEFGCGTGELGIKTIKAYKQLTTKQLTWIGVEIDKRIHEKINKAFIENNISESLGAIVTTLDELPYLKNPLIVFPYSLDNIPPQIFLNAQTNSLYPNALLGITFANGMLSETIIPPQILHEKGMTLENGLFRQKGFTYKLSGWKLRKGQRLYISTDVFSTIYQCIKRFENPTIIIIDEFRKEPWSFDLGNLGVPKSLYEKNLSCNELERYYHESSSHNLYYPLYKESIYKFLSTLGFTSVEYEIEQKKAAEFSGKNWLSVRKNYATYAFIAKNFVAKENKILPIPSPQRKII